MPVTNQSTPVLVGCHGPGLLRQLLPSNLRMTAAGGGSMRGKAVEVVLSDEERGTGGPDGPPADS